MIKKGCLLLASLLLCGCISHRADKLAEIDVANDLYHKGTMPLSSVVNSLEYIKLQTDSSCLIGRSPEFYVTADYVVAIDNQRCLLFSRKNGRFVREVLHKGQDDTGYKSTLRQGNVALIEETGELMFQGWQPGLISIHSLESGQLRSLQLHGEVPSIAPLGKDAFVSAESNMMGNAPYSMYFYEEGQAVDSIANSQTFDNLEGNLLFLTNDDFFYRYAGGTYYKNATNDTIYQVDLRGKHPHAVFRLGDKVITLEMRHKVELYKNNDELCQIVKIMEDDQNIYYQTRHHRDTQRLVFKKTDGKGFCLEKNGLANDIDGKVDLWPHRISLDGEYLFVIDPTTISEDELTKLGTGEEDNPVIVIGRK